MILYNNQIDVYRYVGKNVQIVKFTKADERDEALNNILFKCFEKWGDEFTQKDSCISYIPHSIQDPVDKSGYFVFEIDKPASKSSKIPKDIMDKIDAFKRNCKYSKIICGNF